MASEPSRTAVDRFRSILARHIGLWFEDDKLSFLAELLASRLVATGADVETYLDRVVVRPQEAGELARTLSVTEN